MSVIVKPIFTEKQTAITDKYENRYGFIVVPSANKVEIKKVADGYVVHCKISDIGTDLLTFELFVAGELEAQKVKERFLDDPSAIYKGLLSMLSGDFTGFPK